MLHLSDSLTTVNIFVYIAVDISKYHKLAEKENRKQNRITYYCHCCNNLLHRKLKGIAKSQIHTQKESQICTILTTLPCTDLHVVV